MPSNTIITIGGTTLNYGPDGSLTTAAANNTTTLIQTLSNLSEVACDQVFIGSAHGLKPNTLHKFYFGGVDYSAACHPTLPFCAKIGGGLVTDSNGRMSFNFFFLRPFQTINVTEIVNWEQCKSMFTGTVTCVVSSADQSSYAEFTLTSSLQQCAVDWYRVMQCSTSGQDLFASVPLTGSFFSLT